MDKPLDLQEKPKVLIWNNPTARGYFFQFLLVIVVGLLFYEAATNAITNMHQRSIPTSFGFWDQIAGFDINQTLIAYAAATSTYGEAFWVGLLNTLLVATLGIFFATFLGFVVGIARLSQNYVVSSLAGLYVEVIRNVPLLLQLLFWYNAVLTPLPSPRGSISIAGFAYLNNRGLVLPEIAFAPNAIYILVTFVLGLTGSILFGIWARRRQDETGRQYPIGVVSLLLMLGLPLLVYFAAQEPITFKIPHLVGFNFDGGIRLFPEFVSLLFGLVIYTAAFIAEVVRAGILSVSKGQTEAAYALGLRPSLTLKLVKIPQAMRVIIPPLTNQYLNLTKNSTLAVFVGYPDLVQIFTGTVLNQTGAAVQVVAITMGVYLFISLVTSFFMNIYNRRMALVER